MYVWHRTLYVCVRVGLFVEVPVFDVGRWVKSNVEEQVVCARPGVESHDI